MPWQATRLAGTKKVVNTSQHPYYGINLTLSNIALHSPKSGRVICNTYTTNTTTVQLNQTHSKGMTRPWLKRYQEKIELLTDIQDNWNGYGSKAPNSLAIRNAQDVLDALHHIDLTPDSLTPSADDGVAFSFSQYDRRALVECFNDGDISVTAYDGKGVHYSRPVQSEPNEILNHMRDIYAFIREPTQRNAA